MGNLVDIIIIPTLRKKSSIYSLFKYRAHNIKTKLQKLCNKEIPNFLICLIWKKRQKNLQIDGSADGSCDGSGLWGLSADQERIQRTRRRWLLCAARCDLPDQQRNLIIPTSTTYYSYYVHWFNNGLSGQRPFMAAWSNCRLVSSGMGVWRTLPLSPLLRVSRILVQFNCQEVPQGRHPTCSSRLSHAVVAGGIQARHGRQKRLSCWVEGRPRYTHYGFVKCHFQYMHSFSTIYCWTLKCWTQADF